MKMSDLYEEFIKRDIEYRRQKGLAPIDERDPKLYMVAVVKINESVEEEIVNGKECIKCHRMTVYEGQIQIRSGDEGSNTFHRCTNKNCQHFWITH
jgi:DNA-directed RNA polymerase subunit M/transcription elongation factor TFIIS